MKNKYVTELGNRYLVICELYDIGNRLSHVDPEYVDISEERFYELLTEKFEMLTDEMGIQFTIIGEEGRQIGVLESDVTGWPEKEIKNLIQGARFAKEHLIAEFNRWAERDDIGWEPEQPVAN